MFPASISDPLKWFLYQISIFKLFSTIINTFKICTWLNFSSFNVVLSLSARLKCFPMKIRPSKIFCSACHLNFVKVSADPIKERKVCFNHPEHRAACTKYFPFCITASKIFVSVCTLYKLPFLLTTSSYFLTLYFLPVFCIILFPFHITTIHFLKLLQSTFYYSIFWLWNFREPPPPSPLDVLYRATCSQLLANMLKAARLK